MSGDHALINVSTPKFPDTFTKVSLCDVDRILDFKKGKSGRLKWMAHNDNNGRWGTYVSATDRKTRLHRFILNLTDRNDLVDHINGDTLDNRRENLRI